MSCDNIPRCDNQVLPEAGWDAAVHWTSHELHR